MVTLLVAADGSFKMPQVDSRGALREALTTLGAVRRDDLLAVEVLWTPEEEVSSVGAGGAGWGRRQVWKGERHAGVERMGAAPRPPTHPPARLPPPSLAG